MARAECGQEGCEQGGTRANFIVTIYLMTWRLVEGVDLVQGKLCVTDIYLRFDLSWDDISPQNKPLKAES